MNKEDYIVREDFIKDRLNRDSRKRALQFESPDTSKMRRFQIDSRTTVYMNKNKSVKECEERLKLYKQNSKWITLAIHD